MTPGALHSHSLEDGPLLAVIHLATQPPGVLQQVTLRRDKFSPNGTLIRFGETLGDEAHGWMDLKHVEVIEYLGTVDLHKNKVTPFPPKRADVVEIGGALAEAVRAA